MSAAAGIRPVRVALVVDNPKRDLRGLALLAYQMARRDAEVFLVPMYQQGYDLPLLRPDLVVLNYARESNRELLKTYRNLNYRIAVLDTEGGVLSETGHDSPDNWAATFRQAGFSHLVDDYCFWGTSVQDAFLRHSGMPADALHITGCPRYDVCIDPWARLLSYPRNGIVLVNTNFSAINPIFTHSAEDEKQIFQAQGWDPDYITHLFDDLQAVFPRYLDAIDALARAMPDRQIQVRPHPFESDQVYRQRFSGLSNVVIDGEGDIFNAIHGADCILHLNCGSSVDAVRMGKIPIAMEFLNSEAMRSHAPLPSRVSCGARDIADMIDLVRSPALREHRYSLAEARQNIEPWYYLSDGRAAERAAEFLLNRLANKSGHSRRSIAAALRGARSDASPMQFLQGAVGLLVGSKIASLMAARLQKSRRGKFISADFVEGLVSRYRDLGGGPRLSVMPARNPYGGQKLSSLLVVVQ